jgi:hypothetical protein
MANKFEFNMLVPIEIWLRRKQETRWVRFGSVWKTQNGNLTSPVDFWPVGAGDRVVLMPPKDTPLDAE